MPPAIVIVIVIERNLPSSVAQRAAVFTANRKRTRYLRFVSQKVRNWSREKEKEKERERELEKVVSTWQAEQTHFFREFCDA